jgi:hypothetical protein
MNGVGEERFYNAGKPVFRKTCKLGIPSHSSWQDVIASQNYLALGDEHGAASVLILQHFPPARLIDRSA